MDRELFTEGYLKAYNTKDFEALAGFYAEDIVFENYGGGHREGRDMVMEFLRGIHAKVQSTMTPRVVLVDGDTIAMQGEDLILARVDVPDLPAGALRAGEPVAVQIFAFYTTEGDTIKHVRFAGWPAQSASDN